MNTHALSVVQEYATTASTALAANFGCIRNAVGYKRLSLNPNYMCARCMGNTRPIDGRPQNEAQVRPDKLEEWRW